MLQHLDGADETEVIQVNSALVHPAVAIGVLEDHDPVDRFVFTLAVGIRHIAPEFDHPQAAVGTEVHRDGLMDQRLTRDDFDPETRGQAERFECLLRRQGWGGQAPGCWWRFLHGSGSVALIAHLGAKRNKTEGGRGQEGEQTGADNHSGEKGSGAFKVTGGS